MSRIDRSSSSRRWSGPLLAAALAVLVVGAAIVVVAGLLAIAHRPPPGGASSPSLGVGAATRTLIGFRTPELLTEHYRKHSGEFGDITREEYLHRAQSLRDTRPGGPVLELTRRDRVIVRFDRASGAFLAFDPDGTIRTFFKPRQGEVYFQRERMRR